MFDISFGELLLIGLVALVVLGPERLPVVARTLGALVARAQRFVASVKNDIAQQTDLSGLAALKQDVQHTAEAFKAQLEAEVRASALVEPSAIAPGLPPAAPAGPQPEAAPAPAADTLPLPHDDNQPDLFAAPLPPSSEKPQ